METPEQKAVRWLGESMALRPAAIDEAADAYRDALGGASPSDVQAATEAAAAKLERRVISDDWVSAIASHPPDENAAAALRLRFREASPKLRIPAPEPVLELPLWRLACAAAVGALLGMLVLTPLTRLLLGMRDVGLLLGAPLGAALGVAAVRGASRSKWLRRGLMAALGVATVAEVWALFSGMGVLRRLRRLMGGRGSALKRIALYLAAGFVLVFARPKAHVSRGQQEQLAREAIDQWLNSAILLIGLLTESPPEVAVEDSADVLAALADKALSLRQVPDERLPEAAEELRQELRNLGFEADPGAAQTLQWEEDCNDRYETFGLVAPGDRVIVEREPVVFRGAVRRKGLVRRIRGRG
jgi:hypothetical protein